MSYQDQLCSECSVLNLTRADFEDSASNGKRYKSIRSGTVKELRPMVETCGLCRLIYSALVRNESHADLTGDAVWNLEWLQNIFEYVPKTGDPEALFGSGLYPRLERTRRLSDCCIQLLENETGTRMWRGRMIDSQINVSTIRDWIDRCDQEHGTECQTKTENSKKLMPRLMCINVWDECLQFVEQNSTYVALSYVWGSNNFPRAQGTNIHAFQQPHGLDLEKLPRTITEAIDVTKSMGYKFLWVDSLCINQDEGGEKLRMIEIMDLIYSCADLTIIAGSGDSAQSGLSGWDSSGKKISQRLDTSIIGPGLHVGVLVNFQEEIARCPWASRGWTYQEGTLSKRCLIFLNGLAYFCCRSALWREDFAAEAPHDRLYEGADIVGREDSDSVIDLIGRHVMPYTMRTLSFESDVDLAFKGIENKLRKATRDTVTFVHGHVDAAFDWAMLWQGPSAATLKRREGFPSWSWMGHIGPIVMAGTNGFKIDQDWLRQRTWINWHILKNGSFVPLWIPNTDLGSATTGKSLHQASIQASEGKNAPRADSADRVSVGSNCSGDMNSRSDKYQFPSYGFSGRQESELIAFLDRYLPKKPSCLPSLDSIPIQYRKASLLAISTALCSYFVELASFAGNCTNIQRQSTMFYTLRDKERNVCGQVLLHQPLPVATTLNGCIMKVLLLSYAAPTSEARFSMDTLAELPSKYEELSEEDEDIDEEFLVNSWHLWNRLNVICVATVHDSPVIFERVGLGVIYKQAIEASVEPPIGASFLLC